MKSSSYFSNIFTTLFCNSYDDVMSSIQNLFMFYTKANIFLCPQELSWVMINLKSCETLNAIEILPRQKESTYLQRLKKSNTCLVASVTEILVSDFKDLEAV